MPLTVETATDVLAQLHAELGDFDPATRALVALRPTGRDAYDLATVELADNGVLEVDDDVAGLVLLTGDRIELVDRMAPEAVRHAVVIARGGLEVGLFRIGADDTLHRWSTRHADGEDADDEDARVMRPRERAANVARRALGLASHVDHAPVTELVARIWSVHVAEVALRLFDEHGAQPVPLRDVVARVLSSEPDVDLDRLTWEGARQLAIRGRLAFGPYRFEPDHAAWLDAGGFAQHVLESVPEPQEYLDTLAVVVDGDLLDWVLAELERRGWTSPAA